jgi:membrane protein implicated in regulation of membrane protease activity
MSRRLQWGLPESPPPKHPYRDTLLIYGALALLIVVVAWLTGGAVGKATVIAVFFFVVASAWSIYRWRSRLKADAAARAAREAEL